MTLAIILVCVNIVLICVILTRCVKLINEIKQYKELIIRVQREEYYAKCEEDEPAEVPLTPEERAFKKLRGE